MYAFLGISLATQDYINPSIDIIKKKGVVSFPRAPGDVTRLTDRFALFARSSRPSR